MKAFTANDLNLRYSKQTLGLPMDQMHMSEAVSYSVHFPPQIQNVYNLLTSLLKKKCLGNRKNKLILGDHKKQMIRIFKKYYKIILANKNFTILSAVASWLARAGETTKQLLNNLNIHT